MDTFIIMKVAFMTLSETELNQGTLYKSCAFNKVTTEAGKTIPVSFLITAGIVATLSGDNIVLWDCVC